MSTPPAFSGVIDQNTLTLITLYESALEGSPIFFRH